MRSLRAFLVLGAFFAFTFPLMPLQLLLAQDGLALRPHLPALVSSASVQDRRHPPQYRRRGRRGAGRAPDLEPRLLARHHRALGRGAGVVRGEARGRVLAVRELARQAAALGVRGPQPAERGRRQGERDPGEARRRRPHRAVRGRHLERRQQRGAVQDRLVRGGQAGGRCPRWAPRSRPRRSR